MTRSANEVQTLVSKAARGAGAPPAQAAAFGRAAVCHLTAQRSEADLIAAFEALPLGPILDLPLAISRIMESAADGTAKGALSVPQAPALACSYADALPFLCDQLPTEQGVEITVHMAQPAARGAVVRLTLSDGFTQMLETALSKILVPDTAASRLAGAGAGLTDND